MADLLAPGLQGLNDCGCCEGLTVETPVEITNTPGLSAIVYRVGTHSRFKQSMLASLSDSRQLELSSLTTRSDDDFAIALLDAWAVVADILTFYQERIANESYLRTATERRSILELARSIGYELRPGVAASAYLAFTVDNATSQTTIDAGTRVQSIPAPGEKAQTYETVAPVSARAAWNAMTPRLTTRHPFKDPNKKLLSTFYFDGISTNLKGGDFLVIVPDDDKTPVLCQVTAVIAQPDLQRTQVELQPVAESLQTPVSLSSSVIARSRVIEMARLRNGGGDIGDTLANQLDSKAESHPSPTTQTFLNQPTRAVDLTTATLVANIRPDFIFANFVATQAPPPGALVLRARAAIFGHNAPRWDALPYNLTGEELIYTKSGSPPIVRADVQDGPYKSRKDTWAEVTLDNYPVPATDNLPSTGSDIYLDTNYPNISPNSYIALRDVSNGAWGLHQVGNVSDQSVADFTLSAKVTKLTLDNGQDFSSFGIRSTAVLGQSEQLKLARLPILGPVGGTSIYIEGLVDGLYIGQALMVCGELSTDLGNHACEYVTIQDIVYNNDDEGYTQITLNDKGLQNSYIRTTVTINGNVAPATHGETRQEMLGSGDASQPFQQFTLHQSPLTYISAAGSGGTQSTLQVYVNDILWHEVPAFYGHGPTERIYITRNSNEGQTTIEFGDGISGSRLPTGQNNVRAVYRSGIGTAGLVKADQLTLLLSRPAGVRAVTNSQDASGAADPEQLQDARQNAPLPMLTLGRIVSLRDYEDFAHAFAGVAKALATRTWDGRRQGVFLTVAGPHGASIDKDSPLYTNLLMAIQQAGDPFVHVNMQSYNKAFFRASAFVKINPDYLAEDIAATIDVAMRAQFSFEARSFGQPVFLSEVYSVMQSIPGVVAVTVNALYRSYPLMFIVSTTPNYVLPAIIPQANGGVNVSAAVLLTLDPAPLDLTVTV